MKTIVCEDDDLCPVAVSIMVVDKSVRDVISLGAPIGCGLKLDACTCHEVEGFDSCAGSSPGNVI